jgi:hypothetical protein
MIKIEAEYHPNPDVVTYHINKKINKELALSCTMDANKLNKVAKIIYEVISDIEGVQDITINKYKVTIFKGKLFDWEDLNIQGELMVILNRHYNQEVIMNTPEVERL